MQTTSEVVKIMRTDENFYIFVARAERTGQERKRERERKLLWYRGARCNAHEYLPLHPVCDSGGSVKYVYLMEF